MQVLRSRKQLQLFICKIVAPGVDLGVQGQIIVPMWSLTWFRVPQLGVAMWGHIEIGGSRLLTCLVPLWYIAWSRCERKTITEQYAEWWWRGSIDPQREDGDRSSTGLLSVCRPVFTINVQTSLCACLSTVRRLTNIAIYMIFRTFLAFRPIFCPSIVVSFTCSLCNITFLFQTAKIVHVYTLSYIFTN